MQKVKQFLIDNKVFLFGILSAAIITVQQLATSYPKDYRLFILAAFFAGISYSARNLRGQWGSILGSLIPSLGIALNNMETHTPISWFSLAGAAALAVMGVIAPPAKSLSYETTPEITAAKQDAAKADAAAEPPKNPPVSVK